MEGYSNTTSGAPFAKSSRHGTTSLSTNSRLHAAMIPKHSADVIRTSNLAAPRLARHMKSAVTQFNALNRDRTVPNVLIIVNHADGWHAGDLQEALTGYFYAEGGEKFATEQKVAADRRRAAQHDRPLHLDRPQAAPGDRLD